MRPNQFNTTKRLATARHHLEHIERALDDIELALDELATPPETTSPSPQRSATSDTVEIEFSNGALLVTRTSLCILTPSLSALMEILADRTWGESEAGSDVVVKPRGELRARLSERLGGHPITQIAFTQLLYRLRKLLPPLFVIRSNRGTVEFRVRPEPRG
ncbi:hypothetical protein RAS2_05930 [Phycisphaerae bacterium RAS2]|nr:hypothetical protein RAS2_05930 [Phycisphaerae bacterium RAS2]